MTEEIKARFKHYPPKNQDEIKIHEAVREICMGAALDLVGLLPMTVLGTREFSIVLTNLESAMMYANAAYARHKNGQ